MSDNLIEQITSPISLQIAVNEENHTQDKILDYAKTKSSIEKTKAQLDTLDQALFMQGLTPAYTLQQATDGIKAELLSSTPNTEALFQHVIQAKAAIFSLKNTPPQNASSSYHASLNLLDKNFDHAQTILSSSEVHLDELRSSLGISSVSTTTLNPQATPSNAVAEPTLQAVTPTTLPSNVTTVSIEPQQVTALKALYNQVIPDSMKTSLGIPPQDVSDPTPTESIQQLIQDIIMGTLLNKSGAILEKFIEALNSLNEINTLLGPLASLLSNLKSGYLILSNGKTPNGGPFPASQAWNKLHSDIQKFPLSKLKSIEHQISALANASGVGSQTKAVLQKVLAHLQQITHLVTEISQKLGPSFQPYKHGEFFDSLMDTWGTFIISQKPPNSVFEQLFGSKGLLKSLMHAASDQSDEESIRDLTQTMEMKVSNYQNQYMQLVSMAGKLLNAINQAITGVAKHINQ